MKISALLLLIAVAAPAQQSASQINADCKNNLSLGINGSGGNVDAFGGNFASEVCDANDTRRWALQADATVLKVFGAASDQLKRNVQRRNFYGSRERYFRGGWFWVLNVTEQADNPQGLETRLIVGPGVGATATPKWGVVKFETGLSRTWENVRGAPKRAFPEGWTGARLAWNIRPNIAFREKADLFANIDDNRDYRYAASSSFVFKLTKLLSLETGFTYKWDNRPAPGFEKTDWYTSTMLVFNWREASQ